MFLVLFAFWLLLNGRWTLEIALTGLAVCGLLYLLLWRVFGCTPKRDWRFLRRVPALLRYIVYLLGQIFSAAMATMRLIWSPTLIAEPALTAFRTPLRTRWGRVILANSITLTPGTITVWLKNDVLMVHGLDRDFVAGIGENGMQRRIREVEGGEARE